VTTKAVRQMSAKEWQYLNIDQSGTVPIMTFTRPEKLNALNSEMFQEIGEAVAWLDSTSSSNSVVMTGSGKAFIAGADLSQYGQSDLASFENFQALGTTVYDSVRDSRQIYIAAVNGFALGGGMEMVLACDVVFASNRAKLGLPEIGVGLLPGGGGTALLASMVPAGVAKDLILSGRHMAADEALAYGLVQYVTGPHGLLPEAVAYGEKLNTYSPQALDDIKKLLDARLVISPGARERERQGVMRLFDSPDGKEGVTAFLDKRPPRFAPRDLA
jgi:enoyl-CoA hydratase